MKMFQVTAVEFGHSWYNIYYTDFIICKNNPMNKIGKKKRQIYKVIQLFSHPEDTFLQKF